MQLCIQLWERHEPRKETVPGGRGPGEVGRGNENEGTPGNALISTTESTEHMSAKVHPNKMYYVWISQRKLILTPYTEQDQSEEDS